MGGISRAYRQVLLNYAFGHTTAVASVTGAYVALCTSHGSATGSGTEVTGTTGYTRIITTWASATAAEPAVLANAAIVTFPTATAAGWGDIVSISIFNTATAGTFMAYGSLTADKTISANDVARFAAGSLTVSLNES